MLPRKGDGVPVWSFNGVGPAASCRVMRADVAAIKALAFLVVPGDVVIPRLTVQVLRGVLVGEFTGSVVGVFARCLGYYHVGNLLTGDTLQSNQKS